MHTWVRTLQHSLRCRWRLRRACLLVRRTPRLQAAFAVAVGLALVLALFLVELPVPHGIGDAFYKDTKLRIRAVPTPLSDHLLSLEHTPDAKRDAFFAQRFATVPLHDRIGNEYIDRRVFINPSATRCQDRLYIAVRQHQKYKEINWWSDVYLGELSFTHPRSAPRASTTLKLFSAYTLPQIVLECFYTQPGYFISGPADPRLFCHDDQLWMSYSFFSSQQDWPSARDEHGHFNCSQLRTYRASTFVVKPLEDGHTPVELLIPNPYSVEKNLLFFKLSSAKNADHGLGFVYNLEPHVIFGLDSATGHTHEIARTSSRRLLSRFRNRGAIHLGAGILKVNVANLIGHPVPVEIDGKNTLLGEMNFGVFHTKDTSHGFEYQHFLYTFETQAPYRVLCVAQRPLMVVRTLPISFAAGLTLSQLGPNNASVLHVWYGADDLRSRVSTIWLEDAVHLLDCRYASDPTAVNTRGIVPQYVRWSPFRMDVIPVDNEMFCLEQETPDPVRCQPFNPSIVTLPPGSKRPYLVVARRPQVTITRQDSNGFSTESRLSTMTACFLDHHFSCVRSPVVLDLEVPYQQIDERLAARPPDSSIFNYDHYVGGEDPRVIVWHREKQLLLSYAMNSASSSTVTRGIWMVNVLSVYPKLRSVLPPSWRDAKYFVNATELRYADAIPPIEKNWTPLIHNGSLYVSYSLHPHTTLSVAPDGSCTHAHTSEDTRAFPASMISPDIRINQGSSPVLVDFCASPPCSDDKRRYVAVFHTREKPIKFVNYVVTWTYTAPFTVDFVNSLPCSDTFLRSHEMYFSHFTYAISISAEAKMQSSRRDEDAQLVSATTDSAVIGIGLDDMASITCVLPFTELLSGHPLLP